MIDANGNPFHTIHLGDYGGQQEVELSLYDAFRIGQPFLADRGVIV